MASEIVGEFVDGPELRLVEARAVDVAEEHGAGKVKLAAGTVEFADAGGGVVQREGGERGEASALGVADPGEGVVDEGREASGGG